MSLPQSPNLRASKAQIPRFLLETGGTCAEVVRNKDWNEHELGPIDQWPLVLQSTLATLLRSQQPMYLFWGPNSVSFYNDAYMPALGAHVQTQGIGCYAKTLWYEIWEKIAPQIEATMVRAESTWHEDQHLLFSRNGQLQASYWTYSYTPVFLDELTVGGALIICTETTKRVLSERRLGIIQQLGANLMLCKMPSDVIDVLISTVEQHGEDIAQVIFERIDDIDYLPAYAASLARADRSGQAAQKSHVHHTNLFGTSSNHVIGQLIFTSPTDSLSDSVYAQFIGQITDQISVAVENLRTRMQGDIFFNLPHRLLCIASTDGHLTRVSPGFAEALGFQSEYLMSLPFTAFVHPDDLQSTLDALVQLQRQKTVANFTNRYRCSNGSYRWFSWVSQPLGGLVYCVVHDITELKLTEKKLLQALDARDAFLSIASHELKTPITSLKLYSQLVERQYEKRGLTYFTKGRIERIIRMLLTQSDRLSRLVEDMLDISRIAAGRLSIQLERACFTTMVTEALASFDLQAKAANSIIYIQLQPEVTGYFDIFRMEQVLSNLITNALRYAPGTSVDVSLRQEGNEAVLRVRDAGPGIPAAHHERIFQRFERFVSPSEVSGLGLGLYISRQIMTAHHGSIHLDTSINPGACFEVRLPLTQQTTPIVNDASQA